MPFSLQTDKQLILSVKEARKLLGQKSKNLTNEELEELIKDVETVVRISVRNYIGSKNSKKDARMPGSKAITS